MAQEKKLLKLGDCRNYPAVGMVVIIHYTAYIKDGQKIDSSRERGEPFEFAVGGGEVISGLEEEVQKMSLGERAQLTFLPDKAYEKTGIPGIVPPNSTLMYDVELIGFH